MLKRQVFGFDNNIIRVIFELVATGFMEFYDKTRRVKEHPYTSNRMGPNVIREAVI